MTLTSSFLISGQFSVPIPGCEVKLEFGYVTLADVPISGIGEEFLKEVRERLERVQDV